MARVGEAFVEVKGDYSDIADNGAREIEKTFDRTAKDLKLDGLNEAFGKAGDEAGERFVRDANGRLRNSKGHFVKEGEGAGRAVAQGFRKGIDKENQRDGGGGGFFSRLLGRISGGIDRAGGSIQDRLKSIFDPKRLAAGLAGGLANVLFLTAKIGGLAGVIFQASSALISFSGVLLTLPGILGAVALAGGTVAIAFSGFGDAVSALASGDLEKINEAMKKLPPSARAVAREVASIIPIFKDIRTQVQQRFFEQIEGSLTRVATKLGGVFGAGFSKLASNLGFQINLLLEKLASPRAQEFFTKLFDTANKFVNQVGPPFNRLIDSFGKAFEKTLPFVDRFFVGLGDGIDKFSTFIDEKVADGSFQAFLDEAFETAGLLGDAIGEVTRLLKAMFDSSNETGNEFLETFTKAIGKLADYFESEPGKEALEGLVLLGKALGAVIFTIIAASSEWLRWINKIWKAAKNVYQTFKAAFGLYNSITGAGSGLANAFRRGLGAIPGFAVGGIVDRPTVAQIGEAGPEAIIPLNNPSRAREVMEEAGLVSIAAGLGASESATVIVYLGTEQITDILDVRVDKGLARAARDITRGDRPD